jgi:Protein of unknown function/Domain of unknown function (DUF1835)
MTPTVLHFVFTPSGAGCLVQALRKAGRDDPVIVSYDDLSFGPIDPGDALSRTEWVANELGQTDWDDQIDGSERVRDETRFPDNRKVAWLTRRSAMEYAGFLDWLWRLGDAPCEVVDLTDVMVSYHPQHGPPRPPRLAMSLGMLHHDKICSDRLWDLAKPLQLGERQAYLNLWQRLRSESAPLRVIKDGGLVSAPISFFDDRLMSLVTEHWRKASRVIGEAMVSEMYEDVIQTGDLLLSARLDAMAKDGRVEIRGGSAHDMRSSEVKLPGGACMTLSRPSF